MDYNVNGLYLILGRLIVLRLVVGGSGLVGGGGFVGGSRAIGWWWWWSIGGGCRVIGGRGPEGKDDVTELGGVVVVVEIKNDDGVLVGLQW